MQRHARAIARSFAVVGSAAALVVGLAYPAHAASGSGSGGNGIMTTHLDLVSVDPPCAEVQGNFAHQATVSNGTYTAGAATYNGPVTLQWVTASSGGPWYEGPDGTHGNDYGCDETATGTPWNVNARSTGTNAQGSTVTCNYTGTYTRTDDAMSLSLSGSCSITERGSDGSDSVSNSPTNESRTATLGECRDHGYGDPIIPDECDTTNNAYTATNP